MSETAFPDRVLGFYDRPMWEHLEAGSFKLQRCDACNIFRYPPGPVCHECLVDKSTWVEVGGGGEILSHATFHKGYLPGYPTPYSVVAVRLDEGPIIISNIEGADTPTDAWIGHRVKLVLVPRGGEYVLPRFELADE